LVRNVTRKFRSKFASTEFKTLYITDAASANKAIWSLERTGDKTYGLDIETAKAEEYKEHERAGLCPLLSLVRLVQVYSPKLSTVYVFDLFSFPISYLSPFLKRHRFVAHNAIFEICHLLHNTGITINAHCSMILSQLVIGAEQSGWDAGKQKSLDDEEDDEDQTGLAKYTRISHSLDAAISREFGVKVDKGEQDSDWGVPELSVAQITYAALDAVLTHQLAAKLFPRLKAHRMEKAYKQLKDIQAVVAEMQLHGMPVDWDYHAKMVAEWEKNSATALSVCRPLFGDTNTRSGKQMGIWLESYLKKIKQPSLLKTWPKTKKGAYCFGKKEVLKYKGLPAIAALLEYKRWDKRINTYGKGLAEARHPITGRIHSSYTIAHTATTRFSSMSPNAQNYPNETEFRNMFKAPKGHVLVVADYSQIELRLQAEISQDPAMLQVYREGRDMYCERASNLFGKLVTKEKFPKERQFGKVQMLSLGYGMGIEKFAGECANADLHYDQAFYVKAHRGYRTQFSTYIRWCDRMRDRAKKLGYAETLGGIRRKLDEKEIYTCAPNHGIQGTAAELMRLALLKCHEKVRGGIAKIVSTVHDEILLFAKKANAEKARRALEDSMNEAWKEMFPRAAALHVADAGVGVRWGDIKKAI
jgi:DNA polymerase I-like protein with 3'-5' exonuclease and polymerase domains